MQTGFIDAFAKGYMGLGDEPDPFTGMEGGWLDDWLPSYVYPTTKARSWEKQVEDIIGPSRGAHEGELEAREGTGIELGAEFNLQGWQSQYENARIPTNAMAKVAGTNFLMEPHAAAALRSMMNAAGKVGIDLSIGNTYRDYETQAAMYQAHVSGSHPAPVAAPGSSNHGWGLAVDLAATTNPEFQWLLRNAGRFGFTNPWVDGKGDRTSVEPWHWEYQGGGTTEGGRMAPTVDRKKRSPVADDTPGPVLLIDDLMVDDTPFGPVLASLLQPPSTPSGRQVPQRVPQSSSTGGNVKSQLRQGFIDAGRPDLAKMVATKDFDTWINAESGWRVDSVSQSFPGHGRNYGLFQFWEGHTWTDNYAPSETNWTADAYTQARLVARYFPHLGPNDIKSYAAQIRNGDYSGWG